jgi:hypothetical protein
MTVIHISPYFSLFLRLKIKLKDHHFDTTEAIETKSQEMLNILTEHDLQDAYKKVAEKREMVHTRGRELLRE